MPKKTNPIERSVEAILFDSSFLPLPKYSENIGIKAVASAPAIIS